MKKLISTILSFALISGAAIAYADTDTDDIVVTAGDTVLEEGVDYTLTYRDNIDVGTGTVIVTFMGNYTGTKEAQFNIKRKSSGGGGGGGSSASSEKYTATIVDGEGKQINASKTETTDGVTLTLPTGEVITDDSSYTITITDKNGNPVQTNVTIKDRQSGTATGKTDENGQVTLPANITISIGTPEPTEAPVKYEHKAYIKGYGNGLFIPDGYITRAETAKILDSVMETENNGINKGFTDLDADAWYYEPVMNMSAAGYITGYEDGTFKPERSITRAEFVAMLMRILGTETCEEAPFPDVELGLWSTDYIYSAAKAGYINGYEDGNFRPDGYITRAETVKIINLVLDRTDLSVTDNPFTDVPDTHWAYKQVLEAATDHVITE